MLRSKLAAVEAALAGHAPVGHRHGIKVKPKLCHQQFPEQVELHRKAHLNSPEAYLRSYQLCATQPLLLIRSSGSGKLHKRLGQSLFGNRKPRPSIPILWISKSNDLDDPVYAPAMDMRLFMWALLSEPATMGGQSVYVERADARAPT